MNINFNKIFNFLLPIFFMILVIYFISVALFYFLPKTSVEYIKDTKENIPYIRVNLQKVYNLYPKKKPKPVVKKKPKIIKKEYKLISNITLKAIYATNNELGWIVIIEKKDKKTHLLGVGDFFKNDFELIKVFTNYVIFKKDDNEYKLSLSSELNKKITSSTTKAKKVDKIDKVSDEEIKKNIVIKDNEISISRKHLNQYTKDLGRVWKNISIREIKKNGKIDGYKILKLNKNSVFGKLGLMRGDILKTVNNIDLKSHQEAFSIYNEIDKVNFLNIILLRGNKKMELNYEID